jgi:hypothetical protein
MWASERFRQCIKSALKENYMPRTMNVFATTEEDLYRDPFEKPKPSRSVDSIIAELNSVQSPEANQLRNQFYEIQAQITELLAAHKTKKIAELEDKLENAILASRKLQKAFSAAKDETFEAFREYKRLERVSIKTSENHDNLTHERKALTLLTKSEKAEWADQIAASKQRAEATFLAETNQQMLHNNLVYREVEAAKALQESVNVVNDIQREINRLSK